jgi:hypothetical protein
MAFANRQIYLKKYGGSGAGFASVFREEKCLL